MKTVESAYQAKLSEAIRLACLIEATARKPGNVHPQAEFDDLCYRDFVLSAETAAPILAKAGEVGVGRAVFDAVTQTQTVVGRNTNLGIALLIAPLAAAGEQRSLAEGIGAVLEQLTVEDASLVYAAIRACPSSSLDTAPEQDVSEEPSVTLLEAMRLAADRDTIAAQYASCFELVLKTAVPILAAGGDFSARWEATVIGLHLRLMAEFPDTLIARKCGPEAARQSAGLAAEVLDAGWPSASSGQRKLEQFDIWLRETGHRRNPGTTADLVAAGLFAALRDGKIESPPAGRIVLEPLRSRGDR